MLGKDETGPMGQGPLTGKSLGNCGFRGRGLRCNKRILSKEEEIAYLKNEQEEINKRLEELK